MKLIGIFGFALIWRTTCMHVFADDVDMGGYSSSDWPQWYSISIAIQARDCVAVQHDPNGLCLGSRNYRCFYINLDLLTEVLKKQAIE